MHSRRLVPEIMDGPDLPESQHRRALTGLGKINRLSRTAQALLAPVLELAQTLGRRRLQLLDVASGAADVPLELALLTRRHGVDLDLTVLDKSAMALAVAQERSRRLGVELRCLQGEVPGAAPALTEPFDVVTCSLFLHHLPDGQVPGTLRWLGAHTRGLLLVSDLERSRTAYLLTWITVRLLTRSSVVHFDGPASVAAAFTGTELAQAASEAGLEGATIQRCWPKRLLLKWHPRMSPAAP